MDFTTWFFSKHWLLAAIIQPELALIWAVYMRWKAWSCFLGALIVLKTNAQLLGYFWRFWKDRKEAEATLKKLEALKAKLSNPVKLDA